MGGVANDRRRRRFCRLQAKADDPASAVEVQLWGLPPQREGEDPVQPPSDELLGVWRKPFAELRSGGDLAGHSITIMSVAAHSAKEALLEALVDVEARAFFSSMSSRWAGR